MSINPTIEPSYRKGRSEEKSEEAGTITSPWVLALLRVPPSAGDATWKFAEDGWIPPSVLIARGSASFVAERERRNDEKWWCLFILYWLVSYGNLKKPL